MSPGMPPAHASARRIVLVEGLSDQNAVAALAERRGRDLEAEGICIMPMGGAHALPRFLTALGARSSDVSLAGLCDEDESADVRRGLERAGLGPVRTRADMDRRGFSVCVADLEDELIRALGVASAEQVVDAQGELGSFRTFQRQPAHRGRPVEQQLRRFLGTRARRKILYARLLVEALDLDHAPRPLDRVLARV